MLLRGDHFDRREPPSGLVSSLQLDRPVGDGELGLELTDPLDCRRELAFLTGSQARRLTSVDLILTASVVDRLVTDVEVVRDTRDAPPGSEQVKDLASDLRRISLSSHLFLLRTDTRIRKFDSVKLGTQRTLRTSRGSSNCSAEWGFTPYARARGWFGGLRHQVDWLRADA